MLRRIFEKKFGRVSYVKINESEGKTLTGKVNLRSSAAVKAALQLGFCRFMHQGRLQWLLEIYSPWTNNSDELDLPVIINI